jgi:hypothetical protein
MAVEIGYEQLNGNSSHQPFGFHPMPTDRFSVKLQKPLSNQEIGEKTHIDRSKSLHNIPFAGIF